ncbi:LOW QUALITY PROTEIN: ubl carboxyl-terminal hydrolase 18 [Cynoglossus semilaevis]|uniref:LOW QUALITY PROTEIN: ubl carboxyl-terminal hydrolase 18 n=1 Tax=Cynoglossus semilaevis TaxID=244447 RepID=UPI000494F7E3|nr:LOW QUALITY PROTEIN: ubl carboxyl-terminal hydrolase 18-like [Cynoglossus semilaevis]
MSAGISRLLSVFLRMESHHCEMRGLSNYHLSCCVNTLLQTLSATWEVADVLERWNSEGVNASNRNVPLQLKKVLVAMSSGGPQNEVHRDFLRCLDRNCVRLSVQHDSNEVFLSILNFTKQQMDDEALALEIQNLYKISIETQLRCLNCDSVQTAVDYLLNLHLHVKEDHNSLESCISTFLEEHELRGINCCFCAECGAKTPSKQCVKFLALPRILCVHLKRFRSGQRYTRKLDCTVTFPESFDFSEIAREGFSKEFTQTKCKYTLYAVVVHSGSAMCGHYTAYVRHKVNQQWYYADDSHVQQASWEDVQGTNGSAAYSNTAYMLMYRRAEEEQPQQQT